MINRQRLLYGKEKIELLKKKKVAVIGLGGVGAAAAEVLARNGLYLILVDGGKVDKSDLGRQILYSKEDLGKKKAIIAKEKLRSINGKVEAIDQDVNAENIEEIKADLIIDATDNMNTRFLINEYAIKEKIPLIYAAAIKEEGRVMLIKGSPCLRCVYRETKKSKIERCVEVGVSTAAAVISGIIAGNEAINYFIGKSRLDGRMLIFNLKNYYFKIIEIDKNKNCEVCVKHMFEFLKKEKVTIYKPCESGSSYVGEPVKLKKLDLEKIKLPYKIATQNKEMIIFDYKGHRTTLYKNGKVIMKDLKNDEEAKEKIKELMKELKII